MLTREDNKSGGKESLRVKIVLVETSHPGNIGGAARAMKTMGLNDLVLVAPKRYPDPQADWRAAGALDVLDKAQVCDTLDEAISDCAWVVGTSTRNRKIPWPVGDAKQVADTVVENYLEDQIAIVFGREDNGLHNEELHRCNYHLQIPAAQEYSSLNLAMAVQVVCYELFQARLSQSQQNQNEPKPGALDHWDRKWASNRQIEDLATHVEQVLKEQAFLDADNPGQTMTRLRRLFVRAGLDETEVQILRGVFKHLGEKV